MSGLPSLVLAALLSADAGEDGLLPEPAPAPSWLAGSGADGDDQAVLAAARLAVSELLDGVGLPATIQARVKTPASLRTKALRKGIPEHRVLDRLALRIIVDDIPSCDLAAAAIQARFALVPGSLDDYIRHPKGNGHQSLHMALHAGPLGEIVEVQVRTAAMHAHAEHGAAAHHRYKARQAAQMLRPGQPDRSGDRDGAWELG